MDHTIPCECECECIHTQHCPNPERLTIYACPYLVSEQFSSRLLILILSCDPSPNHSCDPSPNHLVRVVVISVVSSSSSSSSPSPPRLPRLLLLLFRLLLFLVPPPFPCLLSPPPPRHLLLSISRWPRLWLLSSWSYFWRRTNFQVGLIGGSVKSGMGGPSGGGWGGCGVVVLRMDHMKGETWSIGRHETYQISNSRPIFHAKQLSDFPGKKKSG